MKEKMKILLVINYIVFNIILYIFTYVYYTYTFDYPINGCNFFLENFVVSLILD